MAEANDQNNERALSQLWIILGLTAIGLVLLALRAVVGRRRNDFPGPLCLPLLGSIGPMWCLSRTPDKELYRLKDEWGSVCALQVGPQPALLISSPRIAKELLNEVRREAHPRLVQRSDHIRKERLHLLVTPRVRSFPKTDSSLEAGYPATRTRLSAYS